MKYLSLSFALIATSSLLSACSVGPDYFKPSAEIPTNFKESAGWKLANPQDLASRGEWWEMFCDAELNRLEGLVIIDNQNIKVSEARVREAQALVAEARSAYFPAVTANVSTSRQGSGKSGTGNRSVTNSYDGSLDVSWEIDIWGKIRRTVEANKATEAATESDLDAARLSAQADLATNYLSVRIADEQMRLLNDTVVAYQKSLELTQNLYQTGIGTPSDYLQAKAQLEAAQAEAIDIGIARAAYEHAVAVLIGKPPAEFSIAPVPSVPSVPLPPITQPSLVLQRRPDVAAAERRAAAANAQIGVAEAAFYPDLTLSASGGYASSTLANWFSAPARVWSIGPSIAAPLFDAGLRHAQTQQAIAAYDETVATYRQTVLGAFQEVEDNLAGLKILQEEQQVRNAAHADAKASTTIILNQYQAGVTSYLNVATAQTVELTDALSSLAVKKLRLTTDVTLIKALGGRWVTPQTGPVTAADFGPQPVTPAPVASVSTQGTAPAALKLTVPAAANTQPHR